MSLPIVFGLTYYKNASVWAAVLSINRFSNKKPTLGKMLVMPTKPRLIGASQPATHASNQEDRTRQFIMDGALTFDLIGRFVNGLLAEGVSQTLMTCQPCHPIPPEIGTLISFRGDSSVSRL